MPASWCAHQDPSLLGLQRDIGKDAFNAQHVQLIKALSARSPPWPPLRAQEQRGKADVTSLVTWHWQDVQEPCTHSHARLSERQVPHCALSIVVLMRSLYKVPFQQDSILSYPSKLDSTSEKANAERKAKKGRFSHISLFSLIKFLQLKASLIFCPVAGISWRPYNLTILRQSICNA